MFRANRSRDHLSSSSKKPALARARQSWRCFLDVLILVTLVSVSVYLLLLLIKVNSGYSQTQDMPERTVRLQIVNGTGEIGLAGKLAAQITALSDLDLAIEVVEMVRFDLRQVPRTFVIARTRNQTAARMFAERIGLDAHGVSYQPLENNRRHVTATLVLGQDIEEHAVEHHAATEY